MFRRKIPTLIICSFCLVSSIFIGAAYAFTPDKSNKDPVTITSDSATINNKTGDSVFIGNVVIIQGKSQLNASKVVINMDGDKKIKKAVATGSPAVYRTKAEPDKPEVVAKADTLEYWAAKGKIYLIGNAVVTQEDNVFKGPRIEYDVNTELVTSHSSNGGKRTQIVIIPGENSKKK